MARDRGEGGVFKMVKNGVESRYWYIQYYQGGRPIRVSSKTEVKQEALAELRRLMGDRDNGAAPFNKVKKLRYSDLREILISHYTDQGHKSLRVKADGSDSIPGLTALDEFCKFKTANVDGMVTVVDRGVPVTALTTDFARSFVNKRRKAGTGNAAINRSLAALRRMLTLAKAEKKISVVPTINLLKEPEARKGFLERDNFNRLVKVLPTHLRPLVTFLYWCGTRIGETLSITWGQVNLEERFITLEPEQTKNKSARIIPLTSELVALLSEIESDDKDAKVFDGTNLRKEWMKACALVGEGKLTYSEDEKKKYDPTYEGLTLHDLRRSAVRNLRKAGVSEGVAMKISGHKTRNVFDRYNIVDPKDVLDAMKLTEVAALAEGGKVVEGGKKPVGKVLTGSVAAGSR